MKKLIGTLLALLTLCFAPLYAQSDSSYGYYKQWYIGKDGGIPFGVSSFSSFGSGPNKVGWSAGMYGGYFFNSAFAVEAYMLTGRVKQTTQSQYRFFWLSSDGACYFHRPSDVESWSYGNLKTDVKIQVYGVRGNINLLGFFDATKESRWIIGVLPQIALVGTKATLRTIDTNEKVRKHDTQWHLGVGGNLSAIYKLSPHWSIGLYSGITYLTGKSIDSTPAFASRDNYIWENGIRVNLVFGRRQNLVKTAEKELKLVENWLHEKPIEEVKETMVNPVDGEKEVVIVAEFPAIVFPPNSVMVEHDQAHTVNRIVRYLKRHPHTRIEIVGYANDAATTEQNQRRALQRAQAVERQLVIANIDADLITTTSAQTNDGQKNCVIIETVP